MFDHRTMAIGVLLLWACGEPTPEERQKEAFASFATEQAAIVALMRPRRSAVMEPDQNAGLAERSRRARDACRPVALGLASHRIDLGPIREIQTALGSGVLVEALSEAEIINLHAGRFTSLAASECDAEGDPALCAGACVGSWISLERALDEAAVCAGRHGVQMPRLGNASDVHCPGDTPSWLEENRADEPTTNRYGIEPPAR